MVGVKVKKKKSVGRKGWRRMRKWRQDRMEGQGRTKVNGGREERERYER